MAVGDKIQLALKSEVQTVSNNVTTLDTQVNTPSTGIEPRLATVESNQAQITTNKNDIATIRDDIDNPTTGITKQLTDIDTEINAAGTGIKARLDDLEQGGTTTMKFRTHTPNGAYEDGEIVQKDGSLWKANSAIDGTATAVPFAVGTTGQTWSAASVHNFNETLNIIPTGGTIKTSVGANTTGAVFGATKGLEVASITLNPTTRRAKVSGSGVAGAPSSDELIMLGDIKGAASTVVASDLTGNRIVVSNASGKLAAGTLSQSSTELSPVTTREFNLGNATNTYKSLHIEGLNFYDEAGTKVGNIDADSSGDATGFGIFGENSKEVHLGYENNKPDMTFTSTGIKTTKTLTANADIVVASGKNIKFEDADSVEKEGVNLRINVNDLSFYGVNQGVEYTNPAMTVTYDNKVNFSQPITAPKIPRVVVAGKVNGNGTKAATYAGSFSVTLSGNKYTITGFTLSNKDSAIIDTRITGTNLVYARPANVTTTSFEVWISYGTTEFTQDFVFSVMEYT